MSMSWQGPFSSVITQKAKLSMVSEPSTDYICGFEVYTGDASGQSQGNTQELQDASKLLALS